MCAEKLRNIKQHSRAAAEAAARRNQFSWLTRSPWTCGDLKWEREISELCDMRNKSLESAHRKYVSYKNMFACRQRKIWKPRMNFNLFFHYFQWLQIKDAVNNSHTSHENVHKSLLESLSLTHTHTYSVTREANKFLQNAQPWPLYSLSHCRVLHPSLPSTLLCFALFLLFVVYG